MTEQQQGLAALGATPVPGDNPTGVSIRYEPEFESIETEINKLQSVHQEQVNWDSVIDTGSAILAEKSKDLTVACYLCFGLFEKEGYAGLATGLQVLHDMITHFWDGLFPELRRLRARAGAVSWLAEKLGAALAKTPPGSSDREAVASAFQLVGDIDTRLGELLQGQDYSLMDLYRPLKGFQRDLQQRDAPQPVKPAQGTPSANGPAAAPADLGSVTVGSKEEAQKVTRGCQSAIKTLAAYLRQQKLSDPAPYRMLRFSAWISIDRLPPNNNGETQLPAAAGEKRMAFQSLLDAGEYTKLINDAEEMLTRAPFWLDVHRYTATALQELGDEYSGARAAVVSGVGEFVRRLPGLLELSFQGGTPFADEDTRAWIESEAQAAGVASNKEGNADATAEAPSAAADEPWAEIFKQAKQLKAKKKIKEALELFQAGRNSAPNERERFLWDLTQARFCYESGLVELALPQLDHLDRQIERFGLEEWEPGLSVSVARLILMCNDKSSEGTKNRLAGMADRVERARVRLYRLDPSSALDLQKKR